MDRVKVAVIGAGGIARGVHLPSLADMEDVEIVAVCDLLEDRAADLAEKFAIPRVYTTYRKMLADVQADAIYALVEPGNLFHVTWHSLDAGCHVFMEKPPGITCFQAESLARKADQAGQLLQVGFNRRHIPLVRTVKELVERHTRVTVVEGCFYKCGTGAFDRGSMSAFASDTIHAVDLVRWIAGGTPVKTAAVLAGYDEPFVNAWSAVTRFDNGGDQGQLQLGRAGAQVRDSRPGGQRVHQPGLRAGRGGRGDPVAQGQGAIFAGRPGRRG